MMSTDTVGWSVAVALAMATAAACSSDSVIQPGGSGGDASATSPDSGNGDNPDGLPYPSPPAGGYGKTARSGDTPGSVIADFSFQGRLAGSTELTTLSLARYYDPCNKRYKILHLSVAAVWCEPCSEETMAVVADLSSTDSVLNKDEIVFVQALDDGPTEGVPATVSDLDYWIMENQVNFTAMLDPGLKNLGGFFDAAAIPWNSDIDVRTMEILDSNEGWAGTVQSEVAGGLAALPATPSYPIPASAGCDK
jgi:hypothetical protein